MTSEPFTDEQTVRNALKRLNPTAYTADASWYALDRIVAAAEAVRAALEQAQAALERAEVFLARQMWMTVEAVDEGVNPEDAREEWDTDALLSETYDHYIALARAALAGQTTDTAAEQTATDGSDPGGVARSGGRA